MARNKILEHTQIQAKIERIAHEIHENYFAGAGSPLGPASTIRIY